MTFLPASLADLEARPGAYEFFTAVSRIEAAFPDAVPVGQQGPVSRERLRFCANLSLSFPAADVVSVEGEPLDGGAVRARLTQNFMGLFGPSSPLGSYFTERLLHQDNQHLARGFLDLIHHRLVSLVVRGHGKYHPASGGAEGRRFLERMLEITGLQADDHALPGKRLMAFAGLIGRSGVAAETIAAIVSAWIGGAETHAEPCLARWTALPDEAQTHLGRGGRLGRDTIAGRSIRNRTTAFGLTIGPLPPADFNALVPGGKRHHELRALIKRLNPEQLDCVVTLKVAGADLPPSRMQPGGNLKLGHGSRLGGKAQDDYAVQITLMAH
ncbi:MAG: type VI secretion system baseplate subunit TssG [Planctomycetes bacterium]|nr:type VI secretion system baseplate subunit TssG [Planctomycetota bacterium]